jgi:hypothetical protein
MPKPRTHRRRRSTATKHWQDPQLVKEIYPGREEMLRTVDALTWTMPIVANVSMN